MSLGESRKTERMIKIKMDTNQTKTQSTNTPDVDTNEVKGGKTFSQIDMDNLAGKVRREEQIKNENLLKQAIADAKSEWDRQAKLSDEQRAAEAKSKYESELKQRENDLTLRERRLDALEQLQKKGLSSDLVDFVVDLDADKVKTNIEKLAKTFNKSVEDGITDKLKGNPPKDFSNDAPKPKIRTAF